MSLVETRTFDLISSRNWEKRAAAIAKRRAPAVVGRPVGNLIKVGRFNAGTSIPSSDLAEIQTGSRNEASAKVASLR